MTNLDSILKSRDIALLTKVPIVKAMENPMDRGAWQATVHGISRSGHDFAIKPPPPWFFQESCMDVRVGP